jgi:transposase
MRYELTDGEWGIIKPMLPNRPRGVPRVDDRCTLNGIFWVLRSGAPWRDLPNRYGPHTTCYNRFVRWREAGVWDQIMAALSAAHDAAMQMIDTSVCTSTEPASPATEPSSRWLQHAVVDGKGLPVQLGLTSGEAHDNRVCAALLSGLRPQALLLADRGYDADWIRRFVAQQGAWANIPPKRNRKAPICFSRHLYRTRNLVERFFNKIKQCRRVATRYDKLAANYLAFVKLAAIRQWLRVYEFTA